MDEDRNTVHAEEQKVPSQGWNGFLLEVEANLLDQINFAKSDNFEKTEELSKTLNKLQPGGWEITGKLSLQESMKLQQVLDLYRELRIVLMAKANEISFEIDKVRDGKRKLSRYKKGVIGNSTLSGVLLAS